MSHTPGPWVVTAATGGWSCVRANNHSGPIICGPGGLNNEANWDLIAAAPDLLAALEGLVGICESNSMLEVVFESLATPMERLSAAKSAIAKARGVAE